MRTVAKIFLLATMYQFGETQLGLKVIYLIYFIKSRNVQFLFYCGKEFKS